MIVEPVAGNMGVVPPEPGFLEALRSLCDASGALLVFDEVITGFRVARGGAQERYGVTPDLTILGKIVGGGLPLAAFGGRADVMDQLAPAGEVYQAGTLSGNPLATAAGLSVLRRLRDPAVYERLEETRRAARGGACAVRPRAAGRRDADAVRAATSRCADFEDAQLRHGALRASSSATCSSAGSTWRRRSSRRCSSRPRTARPRSRGRWRRLPTSSVDVWEVIADEAAAESPLWAECAAAGDPRARAGLLAARRRAVRRSGSRRSTRRYLLHYGRPRLFAPRDRHTALLLGDYLYAHGLVRVAEHGEVEAVAELAALISRLRAAPRRRSAGDGEAWAATRRAASVRRAARPRRAREVERRRVDVALTPRARAVRLAPMLALLADAATEGRNVITGMLIVGLDLPRGDRLGTLSRKLRKH